MADVAAPVATEAGAAPEDVKAAPAPVKEIAKTSAKPAAKPAAKSSSARAVKSSTSAKPSTSKAVKAKKPVPAADHPSYREMIGEAIVALKERGGSSRQAILKYVMANYKVGSETTKINARVKTALKAGVKAGALKQAKGTGAAGSFKLGEKKAEKKPKAKKVKKPKAAAKPKKAGQKMPQSVGCDVDIHL